ncbi:hypothetical protein HK405_000458, partial [Cladochytrium tenue]
MPATTRLRLSAAVGAALAATSALAVPQPASATSWAYAPSYDASSHTASFSASIVNRPDCVVLGTMALASDSSGFCAGLPDSQLDNCRAGIVGMVDQCDRALTAGQPSFDFSYSFQATPEASKQNGSSSSPVVGAAAAGSLLESTDKVSSSSNSVAYRPTFDSVNRIGSLKATIDTPVGCRSLVSQALSAESTGFCYGLPDTSSTGRNPLEDCMTGLRRMAKDCVTAFSNGDNSYNFDFSFRVPDAIPTQATKANQNVVNYRPSFDAATHVGSVKETAHSLTDCLSLANLALAEDSTGFCSGLPESSLQSCRSGLQDVVNSCLAAFRSDKASFDFTYSYSVDPAVVADIVRPTASAKPPPAAAAAAQPTSAEALYKPTVDVASR